MFHTNCKQYAMVTKVEEESLNELQGLPGILHMPVIWVFLFAFSQNRISMVALNGKPLFFQHRDRQWVPTLRLLHECEFHPLPSVFVQLMVLPSLCNCVKFWLLFLCYRPVNDAKDAGRQRSRKIRAQRFECDVPGTDVSGRPNGGRASQCRCSEFNRHSSSLQIDMLSSSRSHTLVSAE